MKTAFEGALEQAKQSGNLEDVKFKLLDLIQWYEKHQPTAFETLMSLQEDLFVHSQKMNDARGSSINLQKLIELSEARDPTNTGAVWQLLEKQLLVNEQGGDLRSQSITLQRMINWMETHSPEDSDGLWNLLMKQLSVNENGDRADSQAMIIQRMIHWVESNDSGNTQRLWELLEQQYQLEIETKNHRGRGMILRRMWNLNKNNTLLPAQIEYIQEGLNQPVYDDLHAFFSFFALRSCLGMPALGLPNSANPSSPREQTLFGIMDEKNAPKSFKERWIVHRFNQDWWKPYSTGRVDNTGRAEEALVLDLPNIHQGLVGDGIDIEILVDFVAEHPGPLLVHVTLRYVLEEWDIIERLLDASEHVKMAFPILHGHMTEDVNLLRLAAEFEHARILTKDKMREERKAYPGLLEIGLFDQIFPWKVQNGRFMVDQ